MMYIKSLGEKPFPSVCVFTDRNHQVLACEDTDRGEAIAISWAY